MKITTKIGEWPVGGAVRQAALPEEATQRFAERIAEALAEAYGEPDEHHGGAVIVTVDLNVTMTLRVKPTESVSPES